MRLCNILIEHSGLCDPKRNRKVSAKNTNVAIKRVKNNAPALAISSDSNIDKVKARKSFKEQSLVYPKRGIFRQFLKIALQVICGFFLEETYRGASLQYID